MITVTTFSPLFIKLLIYMFVHCCTPLSPLLKGCTIFQKLGHLGGGGLPKASLERGNNSEKGEVDVEMGGCHFFITLQFNYMYCVCVCLWEK